MLDKCGECWYTDIVVNTLILKAVGEFLDTAHDTSEAIKEVISMELHHIEPRRKGGSNEYENLQKVTPWEHDAIDEYRHFVPRK